MASTNQPQELGRAPAVIPTSILDLSNELFTFVISNLEPPAAVCLALTCKQLRHVVLSACQTSMKKICPISPLASPPAILQTFRRTRALPREQQYAQIAIMIAGFVFGNDGSCLKSFGIADAYTELSRLLSGRTRLVLIFGMCYPDIISEPRFHTVCPYDSSGLQCFICLFMGLLADHDTFASPVYRVVARYLTSNAMGDGGGRIKNDRRPKQKERKKKRTN